MYIRLDEIHRLVYQDKTREWILYRAQKVASFSEDKYQEMIAKKKPIIILEDTNGVKAFGIWKRISAGNIGSTIHSWIYSKLNIEFKDTELSAKKIIKFFDSIRTQISNAVTVSGMLRMYITMGISDPAKAMDALNEKVSTTSTFKKGVDPSVYIKQIPPGPDTTLTSYVVDVDSTDIIGYDFKVDKKTGDLKVVRTLNVIPKESEKRVVFVMDNHGNEIIKTNMDMASKPYGRKKNIESKITLLKLKSTSEKKPRSFLKKKG